MNSRRYVRTGTMLNYAQQLAVQVQQQQQHEIESEANEPSTAISSVEKCSASVVLTTSIITAPSNVAD